MRRRKLFPAQKKQIELRAEKISGFPETPWLSLQPDLQYVVNPGGGVPDPADPAHQLRNELVVSTRATVVF